MANILFIKQGLLEEVEDIKQGNLSSEKILTLNNGLSYTLEPSILIGKEQTANPEGKKYEDRIYTIKEIEEKAYDLYMDTIIIEDFVFKITDGFKATLIEDK